jgi:hypothetical protein
MLAPKLAPTVLIAAAAVFAGALVAPAAAPAAQQSFTATGRHAFVVPIAVTRVRATLVGGTGGGGSQGSTNQAEGGPGATVRVTLAVTPGQTLYADVAGNGEAAAAGGAPGGLGGGGMGGGVIVLFVGSPGGGGGGGASVVRACAAPSCPPLVVAGGGGGGGGRGLDTTPSINGGNGGAAGLAGNEGEPDVSKSDVGGGGGLPGTATAGGGAGANSWEIAAAAGIAGAGGAGGNSIGGGGGGGGGGLYGGGGGGAGMGFADFDKQQFFNGGGGGGGGGASGVPAGAAGVSGFTMLPTTGAGPSVAFSWDPPAPTVATGTATVAGTTATLTGTVNPNLAQVTDCHFTIAPAIAAGASLPCAQQLDAGGHAVKVSATAAGLAPATTYSVRLAAANAVSGAAGKTVTFTTPAAAPLRVTGLILSPSRFRRGTRAASIARARKGTTLSFTLSAPATVRLTFKRVRAGHARRVPGAVTLDAPAGANRIRFQGVLDSGRRLRRGRYRMTLVAADAAGRQSAPAGARFRIVR